MKIPCFLRQLREAQDKTLREVELETGIARGQLSLYEQGKRLVEDRHQVQITDAYGAPPDDWYPPALLLLIERDEHRQDDVAAARARARSES